MRDKRRKTPGISLSAAGRHTRLAPGHAGAGKAGTPFWRRTDRHNAPRKAPLWSALSSLLLLWLGVGGTVFAVVTGFDLPVGRGAVALSCAAVPAVVWFLALPLRAGAPAAPSCAAAGSGAPGVRRGKRPARCGFDCTEYHTGVPCIFSGGPRVVFRCANDVGKPFPDNIFLCLCGDFGGVAGRGSAVAAFGFVFGRADSAAVLPAAGSNAGCRARSAADVPVVLDAAAADTCAAALHARRQAGRVTWGLLAPALALLLGLQIFLPDRDFIRPSWAGRMQRDVIALVQGNTPSALPWRASSGGGLRLETAGPRVYTGRTVLRVECGIDGVFYLRGASRR